ncbi:hypothetical protein BWQ96_01724 [Gracilariopsis chorda]|uniref:Uncharacterized protein n=1 Tax=Gracilariopsis chorda TaxID=448386 RepID=A0A2V3J2F0_9FLOR|nr:hypothetical protein BWQ96_01724 [Gracilariopsis chorda]|eukprot:PXF48555.1 hypothetical protein BWQ96_01724 [Gracilariopsis chorda]
MYFKQLPPFSCALFPTLLTLLLSLSLGTLTLAQTSAEQWPDADAQRNQTHKAFNLFTILLADEYEGVGTKLNPDYHIVFKEGTVHPHWKPVSNQTNSVSQPSQLPFHQDEYADRTSFEFSYASFASYEILSPQSTSSDPSVARPKVIEFYDDDNEHSGSFTIVHDCQIDPKAPRLRNVTISVVFPVVDSLSAVFSFQKTCGQGVHQLLDFGYYEDPSNGPGQNPAVQFTPSQPPLVVGPHITSTKLYLRLLPPASSQEFFHITVNTSSMGLNAVPKGPIFGGVLRQSETSFIHVLYECQIKGVSNVSISIPLLPFESLHASWVKDCGGGSVKGLTIGTESWERGDVVNNGVTSTEWEKALHITSNDAEGIVPSVNSSVRFKDFWITNEGNSVHIDPVLVTIERSDVVSAFTSATNERGAVSQVQNGGVLAHNDLLRLRLRTICKKRGSSLIVVTIPVKSFRNVEFGLLKHCRAPRRYKHSGFLRTAESVVTLVTLFIAFSFLYWWRLHVSRKRHDDSSDVASLKHNYRPV